MLTVEHIVKGGGLQDTFRRDVCRLQDPEEISQKLCQVLDGGKVASWCWIDKLAECSVFSGSPPISDG